MTIAKLLAGLIKATPRTAAQLREDLARIDTVGLAARVIEIEIQRRDLLLRGTDADLELNAKALAAANLDVERAQAGIEELNRQIAEADTRESAAELEAQAATAESAIDQLSALYGKIDAGTADIQRLFTEANRCAATIAAWNRRAQLLGRPHLTFTEPAVIKQRTIGAIRA